jgi:hypothetical protein
MHTQPLIPVTQAGLRQVKDGDTFNIELNLTLKINK